MSARRRRGLFVTFEGIEGSGKSSQIARLSRRLRRAGHPVTVTREPGGTRTGERIRSLFLGRDGTVLVPWTELFLMEAARAQHLTEIVRPALAGGRTVLCDRYTDSTLAYQGYGRGLPRGPLEGLHRLPGLLPAPDLTFLFDLAVPSGLERAGRRNAGRTRARGSESRLDDEPRSFHDRVRRGFLALARRDPRRIVVVAADRSPETITGLLMEVLAARLGPGSG